MKSVTKPSDKRCTNEYPCLKESSSGTGLVILFQEPGRGVVVAPGTAGHRLGHYSVGWLKDPAAWNYFEGTVELSQ